MATLARTRGITGLKTVEGGDVAHGVMRLLQIGFVVAPTLAGLDKFFMLMTNWDRYLAPPFARLLGGHTFMLVVGAIEVAAGLLVALKPKIGGFVVAAWMGGIIFNLVVLNLTTGGGYWDIALRDLGLMIGALSLGMLALAHDRKRVVGSPDVGPTPGDLRR